MQLKMLTFSNNLCTIGNIYHGDDLICCTMERPWLKNKVNVSCIPAGVYTIKPVTSPKFGFTYKVENVTGRKHILFHKGNTIDDSLGCIMPVSTYGILNGKWAGLSSKAAYNKLMSFLGGENHELTIKRY